MSDIAKITASRKAGRDRSSLDWAGIEELRNIADALEGIRQDLTALCHIAGTNARKPPP